MVSDQILLGLVIGSLLYAATVVLAVGRRWLAQAGDCRDQLIDHETNVVVCPSCKTDNELGYRYAGTVSTNSRRHGSSGARRPGPAVD